MRRSAAPRPPTNGHAAGSFCARANKEAMMFMFRAVRASAPGMHSFGRPIP
jgi:hypothetical protein